MQAKLVGRASSGVLVALGALLLLFPGCGGGAGSKGSANESTGAPRSTAAETLKALPLGPSDVLAGTATVNPPAGTPGVLSVVTVGRYAGVIDTRFPVIVRNNTSDAVSHVDMAVTAKNAAGKVIAAGTSQFFSPQDIDPGEASLGYVYFSNKVPSGLTHEFSFDSQAPSTDSFSYADLKVNQANHVGSHIAGIATNKTGKTLEGPFSVTVYCFTPADKLTTTTGTYANGPNTLVPNKTVSFDIDLVTLPCPRYLVGSSGFYK